MTMSEQADDKRRDFEKEALVHLDALFGLALRLTGGDFEAACHLAPFPVAGS